MKDNKQRGSDVSREKLFAGECEEDGSRSAGCAAAERRTVGMFTR